KHKETTVKRLTGGVKMLLDKAGVKSFVGAARFLSPTRIEVSSESNKTEIESEYFIIATGARPMQLPMLRQDGKVIFGARESIDVPSVPAEMLVVGAGPIGVEMATVYQTLGSKVTIVEILDAVLPFLDSDISQLTERALKKQGMKILLSSKVTKSEISGGKAKVTIESHGKTEERTFDAVLVAAGMIPNTADMGLDKIGVKLDAKGFVLVDQRMRTNVASVFAIGDVAGGVLLAHKASHEGMVAAEAVAGSGASADWKAVPYAVFCDPEVAGIGLTEKEATQKGLKVRVGKFPYQGVGKAVATLATDGFAKVISDAETDAILGIHVVGPHAGDIVFTGTAVMELDCTAEDLGHLMAIHPTLSEALMESGLAAHKKAIHIPN
ncbi:MAG: FAD-dependent oxidoreductase, partial [candidate division Zixibacteria bacterium]|nr:FAD-dependent oxidoreductase [candidate division Zixibacteria bacterium]